MPILESVQALTIMQIVSLLLGSGVLITLLRLTFLLGQYSQRVQTLETMMIDIRNAMASQKQDFTVLLREMQHELTELRRTRT